MTKTLWSILAISVSSIALTATAVQAEDNTSGTPTFDEIIVTAQKREQSANSVGLSVQVISAEMLDKRGIKDTSDLIRLVPGFTFTPSPYATPVYTLRGVGLYDSALGAAPSVSVYVDEIPLAFPIMTKAAALDVERVEVLKGPQGMLFGQSSTGGAINYIAAKPTDTLEAGANAGLDHFGQVDIGGFVSGPLSDTVNARLAARTIQGGAWQKSTSRDDELGDKRLTEGRLLIDWQASETLSFSLNINGFMDKSDPLAPALIRIAPTNPALIAPGFEDSIPATNPGDADWPEGQPRMKNGFFQIALRGDYDLSDEVTLTSISSYQKADIDQDLPFSGTPFPYQNLDVFGFVKSFNQEVRLSGLTGGLNWIVGASYEHFSADDHIRYDQSIVSNRQPFSFVPAYKDAHTQVTHSGNTYAIFGNLDYQVTEEFSVRGGLRYTKSENSGSGCSFDDLPSNELGGLLEFLQLAFKGDPAAVIPTAPFQCISLDENFDPIRVPLDLDEDSVSWRFGADYKLSNGTLFYATYSRGYKAGIFPNVAATNAIQYAPVVQERLDAYEIGIKAPLFDQLAQLNMSGFYYDYVDKQIRGTVLDPFFGKLEKEINVPKSLILGIEAEIIARPVEGLLLTAGGTFIDSEITQSFVTFNSDGVLLDAKGAQLPFTPKWQLVGDAQYNWDISDNMEAFVGAGATHHSSDNGSLATDLVPANEFAIPSYTLVDLRAGLMAPDESWKASIWVRNVGNVNRWDTVFRTIDDYFRYPSRPRTFGMSVSFRIN